MMKRWKGRLNIDHKINQFEDKPASETIVVVVERAFVKF